MKHLKFITTVLVLSLLTFTSCQNEIDTENGENPNTNSANSATASNLERASKYDGSFDDFLDGNACSSILLPVTATVNGTQITLVSQANYQQVIDILAEFNDDDDQIVFDFPLTVKLSNYTEVVVSNQSEYDAIIEACQEAENAGESAISCLDINFPITILTFSLNLEQTGSVVIESEQDLYAYINNFGNDELFAVNYPITATLADDTVVTITSDADLQSRIDECLSDDADMDQAEENADALETILVNGLFKVDSFVSAGVDTASDYAEFTIDFANDWSCVAQNTVNTTVEDVQGTYEVASEFDVFLSLNFSGNSSFELLNQTWKVTNYSETSISLQSTTNAGITLVLNQI
jgi:hypothetical protein